jgi:hypothetical protein
MTTIQRDPIPTAVALGSARVHWGAVIGGALCAAALALVLHGFAATMGLAVASTSPTWRDASIGLWILSGVYLILVALASYGLGGYIAGWIRSWSPVVADEDADTTEGTHGLLVWAIATLLTALTLATAVATTSRLSAPSGGNAGPAASVGSENIIAFDIDRLLRSDGRASSGDYSRTRAEAGRILLTASGHDGVSADDRQYLVRLVAAQTNLTAADAERRVDTAITRARENVARARRSSVILAFMAGAAALLGAAAAWFAAGAGARHGRNPDQLSIWGARRSITSKRS